VFGLSRPEPGDSQTEQARIHLVEPPARVGVRQNPSLWPTAAEPAVQLSLFG